MVFFRKLYLIASVVFIGYFSWQRCFATASEWKRWQRRCDRLTKLQQRITFPPLKSIAVEGVTHTLPLKAVGPPERNPTQEELEYLVGFFDGDGCVTMKSQSGEIFLQITQSMDSAQILLLFRDKLGGGVFKKASGTGKTRATLRWQGLRVKDTTCRSFACSDSINEAGAVENSCRWQNCTPKSRKNSRAAIPVEAEGSRRKEVKMYLVILCWFL